MFKPARAKIRLKPPSSWEDIPSGEMIKSSLEQTLRHLNHQMFGYYLVALGNLSAQLDLDSINIKHKFSQILDNSMDGHLMGDLTQLPFKENSIDALVLANQLDFASDPHGILREVNRVITADGHVILSGFNPLSLLGLCRFLPIDGAEKVRHCRFFTPFRVKDWLQLLGFEIIADERLLLANLIRQKKLNTHSRLQQWSRSYLPWLMSLYVIVAKKQSIPLSPIRPKWRPKPNLAATSRAYRTM